MTKHWTVPATASLATLLVLFAPALVARADIFQWEYINPANPALGKQQSTMLAPHGAGVIAAPGADLSYRNLTMAYLIGADLTGAYAREANLNSADLSQANLTNAILSFATLTNTNLTGAEVRGANFMRDQYSHVGSGISIAQLYSTASYLAHDLTGIGLGDNDLAGVNLASQNLTNATVYGNLTNANFSQANLTNASLSGATLTSANLNGAEVRGADFVETTSRGFTAAQLYSTASYQARDLTGIGLSGNSLSGVNLAGQNLTNASFTLATLTNANFSQANLTNASFTYATLTGANLTGAEVRHANFVNFGGTGITMAQLYSTASYQAHDLTGIDLAYINLTGGNLAGQNLTNASLSGATLANADLSQANLTNASLAGATLTSINLSGAEVRGAHFTFNIHSYRGGITAAQLYSTASYQAHDLSGIGLESNNLAGVNLAGQNLTNASLGSASLANANLSQANLTGADFFHCDYYCGGAYLAGANLSQANLTNANFSGITYPIYDEWGVEIIGTGITPGANLTNANLSGADARGATFEYATLSGANFSNLIWPDGHLGGLELTAGASLVVRDYDGNPAVPAIVVDQHLAMDVTGTLRLVFESDAWNSTISFAPGIAVALGGTLELTFAPNVNLASQLGRTIDLFDWTGVNPTGAFAVSSPYVWDLSNLYTTGEVTLAALSAMPGDFNNNGVVDAADYIAWRKTDGTPAGYNAWRTHFGQPTGAGTGTVGASSTQVAVPEPATLVLLVIATAGLCLRRDRGQ